jgi:hypothetical protein
MVSVRTVHLRLSLMAHNPDAPDGGRLGSLAIYMKSTALAVALLMVLTAPSFAQASCKGTGDREKLAGAALNSFMKKCRGDAQKACNTSAAEKKLAGTAKTSFTKKCVSGATG